MKKISYESPEKIKKTKITLEDFQWKWEKENEVNINEYFDLFKKNNDNIWNGENILMKDFSFIDGVFSARLFKTNYATLLYYRDHGYKDDSVRMIYGSAFVVTSDMHFIIGEMSDYTSSPGVRLIPSGGISTKDINKYGYFDIEKSIERELKEETGICNLNSKDIYFFEDGKYICMFSVFMTNEKSDLLKENLKIYQESVDNPELINFDSIPLFGNMGSVDVSAYVKNIALTVKKDYL